MPERIVETRSRKLRVLQAEREAAPREISGDGSQANALPLARPRSERKPDWIRMKMPQGEVFFDLKQRVAELGLHTVC